MNTIPHARTSTVAGGLHRLHPRARIPLLERELDEAREDLTVSLARRYRSGISQAQFDAADRQVRVARDRFARATSALARALAEERTA